MNPMTEKHFAILRRHMVEQIAIHVELMSDELGQAVLHERVGAGPVDADRAAVRAHLAVAVEDRPHAAGLVGARVRAGLVGSGDGDQRLGVVLGAQRGEGRALEAEQLLDDRLGVGVGALAVVVVDERQALVDQLCAGRAEREGRAVVPSRALVPRAAVSARPSRPPATR